ncbi:MAG: RRXRR domain-containing protein [Xenococcaceae cyanobacterium MO_167.B52]|nr:RRXRR domain-containing protein [Xenococcaceae cyanobacterium MO_167.B52]
MQKRVPVLNPDGSPAMPTKCSRARRMVRDGKAIGKFNKLGIYYIQLTFEPCGRKVQPISCGLDPGKKYAGVAVQSKRFTLFTAHLFLPFETVKKRMEQRRMMRRGRRGRRINRNLPFELRAHRQKRYSNRRNKKVAPSIRTNRQLEISVISQLCKFYPLSTIVFEYVKADVDLTSGRKKAGSGKGFSPVMVGQVWAIEQLSKLAPVVKKLGWQTSNLRKYLGLEKQKKQKGDAIPFTHATDAISLAATQFIDYLPFENPEGKGHCWKREVTITDAPFYVIRRPPISRRQLHLMLPSKGGNRRKYGGTITRHHDIRKGDYVEGVKAGITYRGWCSGDTLKQVSISNTAWKRIGQFTASKVKLLRRSTRLICTRETDFNVAV